MPALLRDPLDAAQQAVLPWLGQRDGRPLPVCNSRGYAVSGVGIGADGYAANSDERLFNRPGVESRLLESPEVQHVGHESLDLGIGQRGLLHRVDGLVVELGRHLRRRDEPLFDLVC